MRSLIKISSCLLLLSLFTACNNRDTDRTNSSTTPSDASSASSPSLDTPSDSSSATASLATNSNAIAITANDISFLRENGIATVLPNPTPSGFNLTSFQVDRTSRPNYDAMYTGPNNCSFRVGGATGGWGAPGDVRTWEINTPLFGTVTLEENSLGGTSPNVLSSAVTPSDGKAVLSSFPKAGYVFNFSCKYSVFNNQQAAQILESMQIYTN